MDAGRVRAIENRIRPSEPVLLVSYELTHRAAARGGPPGRSVGCSLPLPRFFVLSNGLSGFSSKAIMTRLVGSACARESVNIVDLGNDPEQQYFRLTVLENSLVKSALPLVVE